MDFTLKSSCHYFVHLNIFSVKFYATHSILKVCIPNQLILSQIKKFNISIIITTCYHTFIIVIRITETLKSLQMNIYLTHQASGTTSLSKGSREMTGLFWRGSHTRTHPSRPPVTNSGAPYPISWPPKPSIQFINYSCAFTE